ncbi:hypothetical protein ITI46_34140 [Streptomyces oryzae]|uniref:Uncharacterized protein n=1 Tax=Streptomyces oryzae TaxID=1434886 RepID=A0ABS3XMK3_9ACTN|nr:hypothetical protein [Streptomyces oryzae]MBO8196634.1 hypothetical protein [Streptomyces oryzae]
MSDDNQAPRICSNCMGQNGQHKMIQKITTDENGNAKTVEVPCSGG